MKNGDVTLAVDIESLEKQSFEVHGSENLKDDSSRVVIKQDLTKDIFDIGYKVIESAIPDQEK